MGTLTVTAAANSCPRLKLLNLNYTSAPPAAVGLLVNACRDLEVLKLAGITSWARYLFVHIVRAIFTYVSGRPMELSQNLSVLSISATGSP